jgi:putative FmdB family regulatory protein
MTFEWRCKSCGYKFDADSKKACPQCGSVHVDKVFGSIYFAGLWTPFNDKDRFANARLKKKGSIVLPKNTR